MTLPFLQATISTTKAGPGGVWVGVGEVEKEVKPDTEFKTLHKMSKTEFQIATKNVLYRLRPYHPEHIWSHLILKVKQGWAWLVLEWENVLYQKWLET